MRYSSVKNMRKFHRFVGIDLVCEVTVLFACSVKHPFMKIWTLHDASRLEHRNKQVACWLQITVPVKYQ